MKILAALLFPISLFAQMPMGGITGSPGGGGVTFTNIQNKGSVTCSSTHCSCTLTSAPTTGNLVVVGFSSNNSGSGTPIPTYTVADNAGSPNSYTLINNGAGAGTTQCMASNFNGCQGLAYLVAPASAGATITATFSASTGGFNGGYCSEFHRSSGTWTLDTPTTTGNTGTSSGTTPFPTSTPTVTVTGSKDLLFALITTNNSTSATVGSPWTAAGTVQNSSVLAEYDLAATTNTAVAFQTTSGTLAYVAQGVSFK